MPSCLLHSVNDPHNFVLPQTHEEFRQIMNGYKHKAERKLKGSLYMEPNFLEAPRSLDWRDKGFVTPVKDQVTTVCVSCSHKVLCPHHTW